VVEKSPVVKFFNILRATFLRQYTFAKKTQSQTVIREKLRKALLYEKGARKMSMKLTPGLILDPDCEARNSSL